MKKVLFNVLRIAVAVGLLYYLLSRIDFRGAPPAHILISIPEDSGAPTAEIRSLSRTSSPIQLADVRIADPAPGGNGDGRLDPDETVRVFVALRNAGPRDVYDVAAVLRPRDSRGQVLDSVVAFGAVVHDSIQWGRTGFTIRADSSFSPRDRLPFELSVTTGSFLKTVRSAEPWWLVLAALCFLAFLVISNWRWRILLEARELHYTFGYLLKVYFVSWMFNNVLPTAIGGDVMRIAYTARDDKKAVAFAATLVDRIVGFIGLFFFAFVISVILYFRTKTVWYLPLNLAGFVGLVLVTLTLFSDTMHRIVVRIFGGIKFLKLGARIDELYRAVKEFRGVPGALFWSFLSSLALQLTLALTWFFTAQSVHGHVALLYYCLLIPIIGIITMIPVSIGGLGVRENSFKEFFTAGRMANHLSPEQAIATALLYLLVTLVFALIGAIVLMFLKRSARAAAAPVPVTASAGLSDRPAPERVVPVERKEN